jgi:hypothetical protein
MNFSGREDLSRRCASKNRINIIFFYDEGASIRLERFADHTSFDSVSLDKRDQSTHFGAVFRRFRAEHRVPSFAVNLFSIEERAEASVLCRRGDRPQPGQGLWPTALSEQITAPLRLEAEHSSRLRPGR